MNLKEYLENGLIALNPKYKLNRRYLNALIIHNSYRITFGDEEE